MITKNELTPFRTSTNTYSYAYDAAGNRLSERINGSMTGASYNDVNQLVSRSATGELRFRGSVNEPISNATVAGSVATLDSGTNFTGYATVNPGSNTVPVTVTDYHGNVQANNYLIVLTNGTSQILTYDLNGNLFTMTNTTTGSTISNVWDAANRLVAVYSNGAYRSVFTYDGQGHRVRQTEVSGTTTNSDHWMLWCGTGLCEERDSTGSAVTKRFFAQGEQISGTSYFFTRDHLGSIREMTDSSGTTIHARYSYDPWGRRTKVSGDLDADFGFTGHYFHAPSGLHLALYRAYSTDLGRWLSRDQIGERGGINLYAYVLDNPVNLVDPSGLVAVAVPIIIISGGTAIIIIGTVVIVIAAALLATLQPWKWKCKDAGSIPPCPGYPHKTCKYECSSWFGFIQAPLMITVGPNDDCPESGSVGWQLDSGYQ